MNILVTGANGQLGHEMQLVAEKSKDSFVFTDVCEGYLQLDITDLQAVRDMVKDRKIDCIVNCAAWTNVDRAEECEDRVDVLNAKAPENLALAMKEVDGLLVHISTDYVFGGDPYNTPCREDQCGTPTYAGDLALAGNGDCEILPCHSDEFPSPVKRPAYSVLDKTKIKETFGMKIPYWECSLRKCMKNLMEEKNHE